MADLRISELLQLAGSNLVADDFLPVADVSASETRKITVTDFFGNASTLVADATIPSAKILFAAGSIPGSALQGETVSTSQIANSAISAAKLANNSSVRLVATLPDAGDFVGQIALDTDDLKIYCWNGSVWQSIKAAGSINTVIGGDAGVVNVTVSQAGDTVTINTTLDNTTAASQFLAGPTSGAGATTYRTIQGADLPTATTTAKGGVIVNGNGLTVTGDTLAINNAIAASTTNHVVTYNAQGLVTGGRAIQAGDLPRATASVPGAVYPGDGLGVDAAGEIGHTNSVAPGTYEKVTVDGQGHVTAGAELTSADLADITFSASQLTSGTISADRFAANSIAGAKLDNFSVTKIGGASSTTGVVVFPAADHTGQYFYDSLNGDLYLYDGNAWQPITITAGEIIFAGTYSSNPTYNGGAGKILTLTSAGTALGLSVNNALPAASATNSRYYFVIAEGGTPTTGNAPLVALAPPDIILSDGTAWTHVDVSSTVAAQTASNITTNAISGVTGSNVQDMLASLNTIKANKAGDTFTGNITLDATSLVYDTGSFNTTISAATASAARTITFPNLSGTVLVSGNANIVNADISATAAIDHTKLAALNSGNILVGNASNQAASVAVTGDITITNAGVTAIGSEVIVNADISPTAAIAFTKLATLNSGNILVGNASNQAASVALSGDATLSNAGVLTLATIADTKLATISTAGKVSGGAITSGTIGGSTAINTTGAITTSGALTVTGETSLKETKETVYDLTGTAINPANGTIQYKAISSNTTFTEALESGQSVALRLEVTGTPTVTWPTITWVSSTGNTAPTLSAKNMLVFWKINTTLYGSWVGSYV